VGAQCVISKRKKSQAYNGGMMHKPKYSPTTPTGECVFCAMVRGAEPCAGKFWEDHEFMAFLSIAPCTPGFSVVITKEHYPSDVLALPDKLLSRFAVAAKRAATMLERHFTDVGRVGLIAEGTGVNHAHVKLYPMHKTPFLRGGEWKQISSNVDHWFLEYPGWISSASGPLVKNEYIRKLAREIRASNGDAI